MTTQRSRSDGGAGASRSFSRAIAKWVRGYSMRYRHAPGPKPTVADVLDDLRRWSTSYGSACQPVAAMNRGLHESLS